MPLYAGFDLGGTHLKFGLIDSNEKLWDDLKKKDKRRIEAVGFGFPGIFSLEQQRILQSPNFAELDNFDLIPSLSEFIKVPFWINNDANMAAFGEFKCGAGKGAHWRGKCGFAGELGHVTVNPDGEKCNCGGQGCLETEVSASKIVKNYNTLRKKEEQLTAKDVFQRAKKGEQDARQAFALAGSFLGIGLGIAINFLNPEKVLLGGAVMSAEDLLLSPALEEVKKRSYKASFQCCVIEKAILGNKAGFLGAALWAKKMMLK
jgi:glucokinase